MSVESTYTPPYPYTDDQYEYAQVIPFPETGISSSESEAHTAKSVDKLGELTCLKTLENAHDPISRMPRIRQIARFAMIEGDFEMRITEPAVEKQTDPALITMFPGFSESPNAAAAREFHDSIAEVFPGSKVMSVSTEGINDYCFSVIQGQSLHHSLDRMAHNRLSILQEFARDTPATVIGVSMGSKIAARMAIQNQERTMVDIEQLGFRDPAIVTPDHIIKDMVLKFPSHISRDMAVMSFKHPLLTARCLTGNKIPGPRRLAARALAMSANVIDLLQGTEFEEIDIVAGSYKIGVAGGNNDPLLQPGMWRDLERRHPDNIRLLVKPNTGHLSTIDAPQAAVDMRTVLDQFPDRRAS